jgi:hypothetical protein
LELTADSGIAAMDGVRARVVINASAALGMAIYAGKLRLEDLAASFSLPPGR